jgi:hypothetical protein
MDQREQRAVLVTGVFGSGKTSVAEEIADVLEKRGLPYALLDLDYLMWFDTGNADEKSANRMMLANLSALVRNYLASGVRFFILAGAIRDRSELDGIRTELRMPLKVVRLTVPLAEIEERLRSSVTTARRREDLPEAAAWLAASTGTGAEDLAVPNDRPIRQVARGIADWLGWTRTGPEVPGPEGHR